MNIRATIVGTAAYTLVTFPLAVAWHVALFEDMYRSYGYFEGDPSFVLGLASIVIQGLVLSALFPYVKFSGTAIVRGLKYSSLIGIFFWTSHVLAFVAKQAVGSPVSFIMMESLYLIIQFGIYGLLIGRIYKNASVAST